MRISSYEKIFPVIDAEDKGIPAYRVLFNGLYGAIDIVSSHVAEQLARQDIRGLTQPVKEELMRRGHLTELPREGELEEMRLIARLSKYLYGQRFLSLTVLPTYDCNFRCPYCYEKKRLERGTDWLSKQMSMENIDAIFAALSKRRRRGIVPGTVTLSGGEPLMAGNMDTVHAVARHAKKLNMPIRAITNGYDLEEYLGLMREFSFQSLQITLDGVEEVNNRRRVHKSGKGSYGHIIRNIGLALNQGIAVTLRVNVSRENLAALPELVEELEFLGYSHHENFSVYFAPLMGHSGVSEKEIWNVLTGAGIEGRKAQDMLKSLGSITDRLRLWLDRENYPPLRSACCGAEQGAIIADPHGQLYTCWDFVGVDENAVGYVDTAGKDFHFNLLAYKWRTRTADNLASCNCCPYVFLCSGGCAAAAKAAWGSEWREFCGSMEEDMSYVLPRLAGERIEEIPGAYFRRGGSGFVSYPLSKDIKPIIAEISREERHRIFETRNFRVMGDILQKAERAERQKTARYFGELSVREYMEHLRRHYAPKAKKSKLIGEECLSALQKIEETYGEEVTAVTGLEVRLGREEGNVDYILSVFADDIPHVKTKWLEFDYDWSAKEYSLAPCVFINVGEFGLYQGGDSRVFMAKTLPALVGKEAAAGLSIPLARLTASMPEGAQIRQVATMAARGEKDKLRLVIQTKDYEEIFALLTAIKQPAEITSLRMALDMWRSEKHYAVCLDLTEGGFGEKIGFEITPVWQSPKLADKFLARLEAAGLCLPEKRKAVREWAMLRPDGAPFIQASILYYKLNWKNGRIYEAKAYLQQLNRATHYNYRAFDRPVLMEMELADEAGREMPLASALHWLREATQNRVRRIRFYGGAGYRELRHLLTECRRGRMNGEICLTGGEVEKSNNSSEHAGFLEELTKIILECGGVNLLLSVDETQKTVPVLAALKEINGKREEGIPLAILWHQGKNGAMDIGDAVKLAETCGAQSLLVTGGILPRKEQLLQTASFIACYRGQVEITVDSCFSPLRALMGRRETARNTNVGVAKGCGAGRDRFAVSPAGRPKPCHWHRKEEDFVSLGEYWERSPTLQELRAAEDRRKSPCSSCDFRYHCLPCPIKNEKARRDCPIGKN